MMNKLGLLTYAEEGAKRELARRFELAVKRGFAPIYLENIGITLNNLAQIRESIDEERGFIRTVERSDYNENCND